MSAAQILGGRYGGDSQYIVLFCTDTLFPSRAEGTSVLVYFKAADDSDRASLMSDFRPVMGCTVQTSQ